MVWTCVKCGKTGSGMLPGDFKCPDCGGSEITAKPCVEGPPGVMGIPGANVVREVMTPAQISEVQASAKRPMETWDHIDRMARIQCCYASKGKKCQGNHPQGTRVIYGYEALAKGVQGAVYASWNSALDDAMGEVSKLVTTEGSVLKSNVLEILSRLKLAGV